MSDSKYIQLSFEVNRFPGGSLSVTLHIGFHVLYDFITSLFMLSFGKVSRLVACDRRSKLSISVARDGCSTGENDGKLYRIVLSPNDLEAIAGFLLVYARDKSAPVDHIDIELIPIGKNRVDALVIKAEVARSPMSEHEARRMIDEGADTQSLS